MKKSVKTEMFNMEEYKVLAEVYDILNPKEEVYDQKEFFAALIAKYSILKVLDCACGTGWHLSMFHEMGLESFGSDISPEMLALAKVNLEGKYIPLKKEDFRTLGNSWGGGFDMVACLTTSLPHMLTDDDVVMALTSMYDQLNDSGILVITNGITDTLLNNKPKFVTARESQTDAFYFVMEYSELQLIFNIVYVKREESGFDHKFTTITYNAMRKSVLERCFAKTGFQSISYYGDFDLSDYDPSSSPKLIVVAQK